MQGRMEGGAAAGAASQEDLSPPIDLGHLARYSQGDRALEREVLGLFCSQSAVYLDGLRSANSLSRWRDAAHSLKGSAQAVGAFRVAAVAARAEALSAIPAGAARGPHLDEIETSIAEAETFIRSLP